MQTPGAPPAGQSGSAVTIAGGPMAATFIPGLNMVCSSLLHRGEELLAERGGIGAYASKGSTFGIPLLYPWANRLAAWNYEAGGHDVELPRDGSVHEDPDTGLPIHGLQPAELVWRLSEATQASRIEAELDFTGERLLRAFPFPHRARYSAAITEDSLRIGLSVTAAGEEAVPVSFGFHPYFELPGCDRSELVLGLPVRGRAVLDAHGIPSGEIEELRPDQLSGPLGQRTFDDSFPELAATPVFSITGGGRRVQIAYRAGFGVAQLYAPPGRQFLAVEPMTAPVNALRSGQGLRWAEPGHEFTAEFSVTVTEALG